jgi:hypothetical protein
MHEIENMQHGNHLQLGCIGSKTAARRKARISGSIGVVRVGSAIMGPTFFGRAPTPACFASV